MKIRLTESQYNNLLKTINTNKKLTITESQYKRLILEANSQIVFNKIQGGQAFKIKASNKDYEFEVIDSDDARLLVRNLNDGRYTNVYFFIDFNGINNNQLITKISKAKAGPYSRITPELIKDAETWKVFTFKNLTNFQVFTNKTFGEEILSINTKTGEEVKGVSDEDSTDIDYAQEIKDNLSKNVIPNNSYQLTFYDDSTLKFFVLEKKGSVISIKFKTKSEKADMSYSDVSDKNTKDTELWFKEQDKYINQLKFKLKSSRTKEEKDSVQKLIDKAEGEKKGYNKNSNRYQGFQTISTTDYTDGIASKWVDKIEGSTEYQYGKDLKIDLNNLTVQDNKKIKVMNQKNDAEVARLNNELSIADTPEKKEEIRQKLKNIQSTSIFNLLVTLTYKPISSSKELENGMEWTENPENKEYTKNFPLYSIKDLSVINDNKGTSFTGSDKKAINMEPGEAKDLSREEMDYKEISDFIDKSNADKFILRTPSSVMRLLGARRKGMIPLEALQQELGNPLRNKDSRDKFIAGHLVLFEPDFNSTNVINNKSQLDIFESLVRGSAPKALVKRYAVGDNHVALNIRDGKVMYTLFIQTKGESVGEQLKENEYYVELKFNNNNNEKKESIAKFKIKVIDYKATKLN